MRKNTAKKTYTLEEVQKNLDQYLNASARRLSSRLKQAWKISLHVI